MKPYFQSLRVMLVLMIFSGVLWLLYRELEHYRYQDFVGSLQEIPANRIIAALILTILNYRNSLVFWY